MYESITKVVTGICIKFPGRHGTDQEQIAEASSVQGTSWEKLTSARLTRSFTLHPRDNHNNSRGIDCIEFVLHMWPPATTHLGVGIDVGMGKFSWPGRLSRTRSSSVIDLTDPSCGRMS